MFADLGLLGNIMVLAIGLGVLYKASDVTIDNSLRVAEATGLSETAVGFIMLSMFTTLPEFSVSVFSAVEPETVGIAIGNALGSSITNICLVLGIGLLLAGREGSRRICLACMERGEVRNLYFALFIASVIPIVLIYIRFATRAIGVVLLVIFAFSLYRLSRAKREGRDSGGPRSGAGKHALLTFLGAMVVVASAYFIVGSASSIAVSIGVPEVVIGATIIAIGTSLPELATSAGAFRKGHAELALGNLIGSSFINVTGILGIALVASPAIVNLDAFANLVIFAVIANLFLWYSLTNERVGGREGVILLGIYAVFLATLTGGFPPL